MLAFLLLACTPPMPASTEAAPLVLRAWTVPAGSESQVEAMINRLLYRGEGQAPAGKAHGAGAGVVVVAAPAETQEGIEGLLSTIAKAPPPTPRNVRISWWVVEGEPAEATDVTTLPKAVADAIAQVATVELPMRYRLRHSDSLLSSDGERAEASDGGFQIEQIVSVTPKGGIAANLDVRLNDGPSCRTQVFLNPGQTLVMGQTGVASPTGTGTIFYVVRPELLAGE